MFHIKHIVSWGYAASPPVILVIKGAHSNAFLSEYFSSAESSIPQTQQNTNEWRAPVGHGCQEVARILRTLLTLFQINKVMNFISHSDTLSTSCGRQVKGESPLLPASPAHPMFFYVGVKWVSLRMPAIGVRLVIRPVLTKSRLMMESTFELMRKLHELTSVCIIEKCKGMFFNI